MTNLTPASVACRALACALLAAECAGAAPATIRELKRDFERPPADARIMMRWWWFGSAVTKPELERELRFMKAGGIGGFEVQPVYPLSLDDPARGIRNLPYLSPEFLDCLRFTSEKARELGLRMDLTLASGWPYGGPHVPITQASPRLRVDRVPVPPNAASVPLPRIGEGEKLIAAFLEHGDRLTGIEGGAVRVPPGTEQGRVVLFFISSRTRQMVKRAAVGAEGFVLDHYSRAAIESHLRTVGDRLMEALGDHPPYAVFSDSLEVYGSDWAEDFLEQFRKRRGYDLTPYLPALAGDIGEKTAAVRHDWGLTLTELANERYLTPIREWARQHGTRFRSQTYGIPPVNLSSNALVDLPEGEGSQWRQFSATRWAASASHLYGRPVTSSETWTWLHSPVFRATPLDMKAEADLHFLEGINQLVGHGWPYSPPEAAEPGWHFYAAAVFNQHNPWWLVMPDIALYLQRISYLLRQGKPANDVALYLPTDDAYAKFRLGRDSVNQSMDALFGPKVIPQILDAGYNFDFIDDGAIARVGVPYRILVLPGVERIPLATLERLAEYVRKGGKVVATRRAPSLAPGLAEANSDGPRVRELSAKLFPRVVTDETQLGAALHDVFAPDVATAPEIGFLHRKLDFAEVYFLVNTGNHPVHSQASFRIEGMRSAWWNPFDGRASEAGGSRIALDLAPYESRVVVFSKEAFSKEAFSKDEAPRRRATPSEAIPESLDISSGWKVTFDGTGDSETMDRLHSWTGEENRRYYSGLAEYQKNVVLDAARLRSGRALFLNFGDGAPVEPGGERRAGSGMRAWFEGPVREAAVVYVNGERAGSVWCAPYEVEIGRLLHAGENDIRIVVANLALNRLAKGPLPDYTALIARYGERFQDQDMASVKPEPSGLLGPIRILSR